MTQDEKFQEERKAGLGGTDIAAICGKSRFKSALQVWREKVGLVTTEETEAMYWGTKLEPVVRDRYIDLLKDRYGADANVQPTVFFQHPKHDFLIAHLDGLLVHRQNGNPMIPFGVLEIKTASEYARTEFGDEWTDNIPTEYLFQVQHYLNVTGLPMAHVAVLIGGNKFRVYEVQANKELIEAITEMGIRFWTEHVVPQVPPDPDGSDSATKMLAEMYPEDTGATVEATGEVKDWVFEYDRQRKIIKLGEEKQQEARNHIVSFMGDASVLAGPWKNVSFKKSKDGITIDFKGAVEEIMANQSIDPVFRAILEDHLGSHTTIKVGSRRFLAKLDEE
ncbi:MAG: YqaJ viral recombinase family protein [Candidatus Micrarchaeia archaeon]|jgi:putative phage-type endonuclease